MLTANYSKLWKQLIDKKIKKTELKNACKIAPSTYTKLNHDQLVSMEVIVRICGFLNCDISDVMSLEQN